MSCNYWYNFHQLKRSFQQFFFRNKFYFATLLKLTLLHECFSRFLNCTNGTKSRNAPHMSHYLWMTTWMKNVNNFQIAKVQPQDVA